MITSCDDKRARLEREKMLMKWLRELLFKKKRCQEKSRSSIIEKKPLTKWHKACLWLAHTVGGVDMLLKDDGSILVISKSLDGDLVAISKSSGGGPRRYLRVSLLDMHTGSMEQLKTIVEWSPALAEFAARILAFSNHDPNLDPIEDWGVMAFTKPSPSGLQVKTESKFPTFKSEEELFMRMALDGFDINDDEEKKEKDSANAQS